MKHIIETERRNKTYLIKDLDHVKVIVRIFEPGNWNTMLPDVFFNLIQEVEKEFETTFDVVQMFMKYSEMLYDITEWKGDKKTQKECELLAKNAENNSQFRFPNLEVISECFCLIKEMQIAMETNKVPNMHMEH